MRQPVAFLLGAALLLCLGATAQADDDQKPQWTDRIKLGGDLRLRYEGFDWDGVYDDGERHRFRYRFRVGLKASLSEKLLVGFQLRSGNPDNPHSDNQSFDGGFDKDTISISEAFIDYRPFKFFGVVGGKFSPKKLWLVSDQQWDDDVVVEGAMENFRFEGGGVFKALEANLYQFVLEESGSSGDAYLFGAQVRPIFAFGDANQLTVGVSYDSFTRPDKVVSLTFDGDLDTEPETIVTNLIDPATGELISDFRVLATFAEWKNKSIEGWPIKVSLFYYKNLGANSGSGNIYAMEVDPGNILVAGLNPKDNDTGYFARVQFGDYKKPGQVAIRVSQYDSEPDAMFYAFVQSDTKRGTNMEGQRLDLRVGMPLNGYVNVTWYHTDWKYGGGSTMDRWQFDYIFKF
jgi:hypothetical protein